MRPARILEPLEPRRHLAADFFGTNGPDNIEIDYSFADNKVHVRINGTDHSTIDGLINIHARGGSDTIAVLKTTLNFNYVVNGDEGDDVLVNPGQHLANAYLHASSFEFNGGPGFDTAVADNTADTLENALITIDSSGISRRPPDGLTFNVFPTSSDVERLEYLDSASNNRIEFRAPMYDHIHINGNDGDDLITNFPTGGAMAQLVHSMAGIGMTIVGGNGNDRLSLDDRGGDQASRTITIGGNTVKAQADGLTSGVASYSGFEDLDYIGSAQADHVIVRDTAPGTRMNLGTAAGDDRFTVGGGDLDASGLHNATLAGGGGNDHVRFDDSLDDHASFDADTLTIEFNTVTKDGVTIAYGSFESQSFVTSGVNNGTIAFPTTVRVNSIGMPTEIFDTPGTRDTDVEVGKGPFGLSQVTAPLKLTSVAAMELNVYDPQSSSNKLFRVTATRVLQTNPPVPLDITHSGLSSISIFAGNASSDWCVVESVAPGTHVFFSGGGGDDSVFVGGGSFDGILGPVHFSGGAGTGDRIVFSNASDVATDTVGSTLSSFSFKAGDGPLHQFFSGVEQVEVDVRSTAGTHLTVNSSTAAVTVNGHLGDDHVTVRNLTKNFTFNADNDAVGDTIVIDDSAITTNDAYFFTGHTMLKSGDALLTLDRVERVTVRSGSGFNHVDVNTTLDDLSLFTGAGNDTVNVFDSTGFVTVNTGSEQPSAASPVGDSISISNDGGSPGDVPGAVRITEDDTIMHLQVGANGTLRIEDDAVLCKTTNPFQLPLFVKGVIDLAGGALLHRADGLNNPFRQWLTAGRNGGAWNGTSPTGAINSSRASASPTADGVGHALGSQVPLTTIGSFTINPGDMLIRYGLDGDANLDGTVNLQDFNRLASNFATSGRAWSDGDFTYDGTINLADFNRLAINFGRSTESETMDLAGDPTVP
jgi:hypothetical protein